MSNSTVVKIVIGLIGVLVVATLLWPVRSDMQMRADERRSADIEAISELIEEFYVENSRLPGELRELNLDDELSPQSDVSDYEYIASDAASYQLCTVFNTDTTDDKPDLGRLWDDQASKTANHASGRVCFDYEVAASSNSQFDFSGDNSLDESLNLDFEQLEGLEGLLEPGSFNQLEGYEEYLTPENLQQLEGLESFINPENLELFESLEL